jgi:hypothetical protein
MYFPDYRPKRPERSRNSSLRLYRQHPGEGPKEDPPPARVTADLADGR